MMKKAILSVTLLCGAIFVQAQQPANPRDAAIEAKVEKTLSKMTLDEKIGQMLELTWTSWEATMLQARGN
jgi:beta-glucosidase